MTARRNGIGTWRIINADCRDALRTLPEKSVQTCITSPPYFGLRDYGHDGQIGLEPTPDEFVQALVEVFREVRRVLRDDGTVWLNLGDSYAGSGKGREADGTCKATGKQATNVGPTIGVIGKTARVDAVTNLTRNTIGVKPKDLIGIPWMVAFALRADGWYLRQDIIWAKPNPMPESVRDRCTKSHEYIFLLSKSRKYFYDAEAIAEDIAEDIATGDNGSRFDTGKTATHQLNRMQVGPRFGGHKYGDSDDPAHATKSGNVYEPNGKRNKRSVWTVSTKPFSGAHFATFPHDLIEPCVLAGSAAGDTVLDPFAGSGTTGMVALRHNRSFVGCELNPEYAEMARNRIIDDAPLTNHISEVVA